MTEHPDHERMQRMLHIVNEAMRRQRYGALAPEDAAAIHEMNARELQRRMPDLQPVARSRARWSIEVLMAQAYACIREAGMACEEAA